MKHVNFVNMDIQAEKLDLIQWLAQVDDVKLIEKLKQFVQSNENDFWTDLTDEQKAEIRQGINDLDEGKKYDYEDVISAHRS